MNTVIHQEFWFVIVERASDANLDDFAWSSTGLAQIKLSKVEQHSLKNNLHTTNKINNIPHTISGHACSLCIINLSNIKLE